MDNFVPCLTGTLVQAIPYVSVNFFTRVLGTQYVFKNANLMVQLGRISKSMRLSPDTYHKLACFACTFLQEPVPKLSKPPDIPKATMVFHSCMPSSMRFYLKTILFHLTLSYSSTLQLSDSTPLTESAFLHSKFISLHNSDALFPWSKSALCLPLSCHP